MYLGYDVSILHAGQFPFTVAKGLVEHTRHSVSILRAGQLPFTENIVCLILVRLYSFNPARKPTPFTVTTVRNTMITILRFNPASRPAPLYSDSLVNFTPCHCGVSILRAGQLPFTA